MIKGIQTDDWLSLRLGRLLTEIEAECYTLFMCLDARSAYVTSPEENRGSRHFSRLPVFDPVALMQRISSFVNSFCRCCRLQSSEIGF